MHYIRKSKNKKIGHWKNCSVQKPTKIGPKRPFLAQEGRFFKDKKNCVSLTINPEKLCTIFDQNPFTRLSSLALLTDVQTDERAGLISWVHQKGSGDQQLFSSKNQPDSTPPLGTQV